MSASRSGVSQPSYLGSLSAASYLPGIVPPATAPLPATELTEVELARNAVQAECVEAIRAAIQRGVKRPLVVMPTGLGKSHLMVRLPAHLDIWPTLILADGIDLVEQLASYARNAHPDRRVVGVERAESEAPLDADIVVASIATVGRTTGRAPKRRAKWPAGHFGLVLHDESHGALAATHLRTLRHFGVNLSRPELSPVICGYSATPWRGDGQLLANVFDEVVFDRDLEWAQERGLLADCHAERIRATFDILNLHVRVADTFEPADLAEASNVDWDGSELISGLEKYAFSGEYHTPRRHVLIFCESKAHVHALTRQLRDRGHAAAEVIDSTPRHERQERIAKLRSGELRVLLTCTALMQGVDIPPVDCVVHAAGTKSLRVYLQRIGRGTRLSPGKNYLLVIDVVDACGKFHPITATEAFGVRDIDCLGRSVLETAQKARKAAEAGLTVQEGESIDDIERKLRLAARIAQKTLNIETTSEAVDLFVASQPGQEIERSSQFPWVQVSKHRYVIRIGRAVWSLAEDARGDWWLHMGPKRVLCAPPGTKNVLRPADRIIRAKVPGWRQMRHHAGWKRDPITWDQIEYLGRLGVHTLPPGITRGSASHLIDTIGIQKRLGREIALPSKQEND